MKFTIMMFMKMYELGPTLKQSMFREGQDTDHGYIVFAINRLESMYIMSLLWPFVVPYADNITREFPLF